MAATTPPDAVFWHEGMRLAPQHFHQQDVRNERLGAQLHLAAAPDAWGVLALEARCNGASVMLRQLEAVMPDGQYVCWQAGVDAPLQLDLPEHADGDSEWQVLLAVDPRPVVANPDLPRCGVREDKLPPMSKGGAAIPLRLLRPQLRLVADRSPDHALEDLLPLLRVRRFGGRYSIDSKHIGTWLRTGPEAPLRTHLDKLGLMLSDCYANLSRQLERANQQSERNAFERRQWVLPHLGAHMMELMGHGYGTLVHPRDVHFQLCRLRGALMALAPVRSGAQAPAYAHRQQDENFRQLLADIKRSCRPIGSGHEWEAFQGNAEDLFHHTLAAPVAAGAFLLALQMPPGASEADMVAWIGAATIGTGADFPQLTRKRISGVRAELLSADAARAAGAPLDMVLFRLFREDAPDQGFEADQTIQIQGRGKGGGNVAPLSALLVTRAPHGAAES